MSADLNFCSYYFDEEVGKELEAELCKVQGLSLTNTKVTSDDELQGLGKESLPDVIFFGMVICSA